ncbi:MAG: GNAT family N-acetyltransferase [Candidatus Dormibacteria bacterium]
MEVSSLGYRSDLMVRRLAGSAIIDRGDYLVVRSPHNPGFHWGNFLLFRAAPGPRDGACWLSIFAAEFPGANHVAIGVDSSDGAPGEVSELIAAGLNLGVDLVLQATDLRPPAQPHHGSVCRRLVTGEDWVQAAGLRFAVAAAEGFRAPGHSAFLQRQVEEARLLVRAGHGEFFGAFIEGRLFSILGLVTDGTGLARFQSVETHPAHRRQGLAGTLVYAAGRFGLSEMGARTLVMVAEPDGPAIGIYRALGFLDAEQQIGLSRP